MKKIIPLLLCLLSAAAYAQNETAKWYFGDHAALDFMTNPPTVLNTSDMVAGQGCSSIADAAGNLLFYTNGVTVWNKQHAVMANGTMSIAGQYVGTYPIIVKQPGSSSLYYIFTAFPSPIAVQFIIPPPVITNGLYYSVVDMSLAGGMGSVTVNNAPVYTLPQYMSSSGQIHATRHANGTDYWILTHEYADGNYRAYLLTSAGINPVPVVSSVGITHQGQGFGYAKFSPTGQKVCTSVSYVGVELFDFDNATGQLSNPLTLLADGLEKNYRGVAFSPDGTKLYAGHNIAGSGTSRLIQWDLSAGSPTAILSSSVNIPTGSLDPADLQLAPNGKIYIASVMPYSFLAVIGSPNTAGTGCNYTGIGQAVFAAINPTFTSSALSRLPNLVTDLAGTSCTAQALSNPQSICIGDHYAISNHSYSTTGTYADTLQNIFACTGSVVVHTQLTVHNLPVVSAGAGATICLNDAVTLTASGASTYSWSTGQTGASITVAPSSATQYTVSGTDQYGCQADGQLLVAVSPCTGVDELKMRDAGLTVYPNPAADVLTVDCVVPGSQWEVVITDLLGKVVKIEKSGMTAGKGQINVSDLVNGVYTICFSSDGERIAMEKLVIAR